MISDELTNFLTSVEDARCRYLRCKNRTEVLRARCENITPNPDAAPGGSGDPHKDANLVALAQKSAEADMWEREWKRREEAVEDFLNRLSNKTYRLILQLKYVDQLEWPQIQTRLTDYGIYYVVRHLQRLHGDALEAARALWRLDQQKEETV